MADFVLYGATGYTGELIVKEARRRGLRPLLAGRSSEKLKRLAEPHGLEWQAVAIGDGEGLRRLLGNAEVVLHAAGPFRDTSEQMVAACLATGTHYLDITGEPEVFEALAARGEDAARKGVMLLPGVGFDVVPTDCLAAMLKRELPTATHLTLAFAGSGHASRGTMKTGLGGGLAEPPKRRHAGRIVAHDKPYLREIDFGDGKPITVLALTWGDIVTAAHSTGVENIEVFMRASRAMRTLADMPAWRKRLLFTGPGAWIARRRIAKMPPGPDEALRASARTRLYGRATDGEGLSVEIRLETPEAYRLTAETAVEITRRVAEGDAKPGFQTPSRVFGADFILSMPECHEVRMGRDGGT
ncbi:MAG: saccharopine dehydrogenase family protein [Rubricella sp.]